jgi:cytoskeleton protein RodZ
MTDDDSESGGEELTAGAMLRAAREEQGLHIAVLAAAIKVSPRKLDALENDRYGELLDAAFTRALAQTMCRALKIDPQPVLARLPQVNDSGLDMAGGGLNMPFHDRPARGDSGGGGWPQRPVLWAGVVLLLAAAGIALVPTGVWRLVGVDTDAGQPLPAASAPAAARAAASSSAPAPVADATSVSAASAPASMPMAETILATPSDPAAAASASNVPAVTTNEPSWIEATDASGMLLLSRIVAPGEVVHLHGARPIRLTIGNARATQLVVRGQGVDLGPWTRDNVARVELN